MNCYLPLALIIFFISRTVCAQTVVVPDLKQIIQSVKERFPLNVAAARDIQGAHSELQASEGAFDVMWKSRANSQFEGFYQNERYDTVLEQPTTLWGSTFFIGHRASSGKFAIYDTKLDTNTGGEFRAGLNLPVWRDGPIDRRRANIEKSRLGIAVAGTAQVQQELDSIRAATHRYWEWVGASKRVMVYQDLLAIAEERFKGLDIKVRRGDLPKFDRSDNERAILQRQSQLILAQRSFQQASLELSYYWRDSAGNPILATAIDKSATFPEVEDRPFKAEEIEFALKQRPDFQRFEYLKAQNAFEIHLSENLQAPRIDLSLQTARAYKKENTFRDKAQWEVGMQIEIPLQTNSASGREGSARANAFRLEQLERLARDRIELDVKDAHSALQTIFKRVEFTKKEVELTKKLEEGERKRYFHGDSNLLFVNLREQASADAAIREIEALTEYHKAIATLRASVGEKE